MKGLLTRFAPAGPALVLALASQAASACPACFGRSDSKLAEGMNMGILSLLFVILMVLGGCVAFFVYLARRAAAPASHLPGGTSKPSA